MKRFFLCPKFVLQHSIEIICGSFFRKKPKVTMQNVYKQRSFCQSLASLVFRSPGSNKARGPTVHSVHSADSGAVMKAAATAACRSAELQTIIYVGLFINMSLPFLPTQVSEERLGLVLKETQQQQEREIAKMQST